MVGKIGCTDYYRYVLQKRGDPIVPRWRDEHLAEFSQPSFKKNCKEKTWRSFPKGFPSCQSTYWKKNCCTFLTVVTQNGSTYDFLSKNNVWVLV